MRDFITFFILLSMLTGGAYFYYNDTQSKIEELTISNERLSSALDSCRNEKLTIEKNFNRYKDTTSTLSTRLNEATKYNESLIEKLHKHDLTALVLKKPTLIETRVNDATQKVFNDIESITRNNP